MIGNKKLRAMNCLEQCIHNVNRWMNQNRLKVNTYKTEFIIFGSWQNLLKSSTKSINVCDNLVEGRDKIKLLGTQLDTSLTFKHQINV